MKVKYLIDKKVVSKDEYESFLKRLLPERLNEGCEEHSDGGAMCWEQKAEDGSIYDIVEESTSSGSELSVTRRTQKVFLQGAQKL